MNKKYKESELAEECESILEICNGDTYMKAFLACVVVLLKQDISANDIEWDNLAEREKFEPADTN